MLEIRVAQFNDIEGVLDLHYRYQVDSIKPEDRDDGFVTTTFTSDELEQLINDECGLFIALKDKKVVAYVMAASWQYWSKWPMFAHMIKNLKNINYLGQLLNTKNSYQYGPVCIDKSQRGTGLLESIFDFAREKMSKRFPILVTFVNKANPRSFAAHSKKLKLEIIQEFEYNHNHYYEMVYDTSKKLLN